jgi:hypothetical protein
VLASVLALLTMVGFAFDKHYVRKLEGRSLNERTSWSDAFNKWKRQAAENHCGNTTCPAQKKLPIVIVAAAGGGLRAAYWTATLLGELHDRSNGDFSKSLFAISGVSGGALGAHC